MVVVNIWLLLDALVQSPNTTSRLHPCLGKTCCGSRRTACCRHNTEVLDATDGERLCASGEA